MNGREDFEKYFFKEFWVIFWKISRIFSENHEKLRKPLENISESRGILPKFLKNISKISRIIAKNLKNYFEYYIIRVRKSFQKI